MTAVLDDHKLTWVSVPKIASTSLKSLFFEIENGFAFRRFRTGGERWHLHRFYRTCLFRGLPHGRIAGHERITVVRDPVRRLLSCYGNRVVHHRALSLRKAGAELAAAGLPPNPDLPTFLDRLDDYRATVPEIRYHTRPLVEHLGEDATYYSRVYRFDELDTLAEDICRRTGARAELRRLMSAGPKIDPAELTQPQLARLRATYAADYEAFGRYF